MAEYELPSKEELKENYDKAKKEWAENKDLGIHSLAGKLSSKYGDFENRILIKKASGLELDGKEKAADTAINKIAPATSDFFLGTFIGKGLAKAGKKATSSIIQNKIKKLNSFTNEYWKKYPWLQDGLPKVREMKEMAGIKPLTTEEMLSKISKMTPEERTEADKLGLEYANNRIKIGKLGKKSNKLEKTAEKSIGISTSALSWILSPFSTVSSKAEQKSLRQAKQNLLSKISYLENNEIDASNLSDKELDFYIEKYKPSIEKWLNNQFSNN